jgi:hypothetical protein
MKQGTVKYFLLHMMMLAAMYAGAQNPLGKVISLEVNHQRLDQVLEIISNKGDFYFSYNSKIIRRDSLVSISARNKPVKEVLQILFNSGYEFIESGNYIIIRKAPIRLVMVTQKAELTERVYHISGYVYDEQTGGGIQRASVYEKKMLASALTGSGVFLKVKLKSSRASYTTLTVSKEFYEDTAVTIEPRKTQQVAITMQPLENRTLNVVVGPLDVQRPDSLKAATMPGTFPRLVLNARNDSLRVEKNGWGRFMLSARQKVQSINLKKFFTTRPFQVSFIPGFGTHGYMSGQVVNNFSLNIIGGYTAGTNGAEIGGVFNINKKGAGFFQAAGVFNAVGGPVRGFQLAGVNNLVLDTVKGFQAAGVNNVVKGNFTGFQVGGVYNHVTGTVKGFQASGVGNFARKHAHGLQIAGVVNYVHETARGVQIAGVINYTRRLKGVQFAVINIADTSGGYSIGLINIILKGWHKLSIYSNEITNVNAAFKTGNARFYSILLAGMQYNTAEKLYTFGYGIGSEWPLNRKRSITINPELTSQYFYPGSWDYLTLNNRLGLHLHVKAGKYFSLFAGPAYNMLVSDLPAGVPGYRFPIQPAGYKTHEFSSRVTGWLGWSAGVHLF